MMDAWLFLCATPSGVSPFFGARSTSAPLSSNSRAAATRPSRQAMSLVAPTSPVDLAPFSSNSRAASTARAAGDEQRRPAVLVRGRPPRRCPAAPAPRRGVGARRAAASYRSPSPDRPPRLCQAITAPRRRGPSPPSRCLPLLVMPWRPRPGASSRRRHSLCRSVRQKSSRLAYCQVTRTCWVIDVGAWAAPNCMGAASIRARGSPRSSHRYRDLQVERPRSRGRARRPLLDRDGAPACLAPSPGRPSSRTFPGSSACWTLPGGRDRTPAPESRGALQHMSRLRGSPRSAYAFRVPQHDSHSRAVLALLALEDR